MLEIIKVCIKYDLRFPPGTLIAEIFLVEIMVLLGNATIFQRNTGTFREAYQYEQTSFDMQIVQNRSCKSFSTERGNSWLEVQRFSVKMLSFFIYMLTLWILERNTCTILFMSQLVVKKCNNSRQINPRNSPRHSAIAEGNAEASYDFHTFASAKKCRGDQPVIDFVYIP